MASQTPPFYRLDLSKDELEFITEELANQALILSAVLAGHENIRAKGLLDLHERIVTCRRMVKKLRKRIDGREIG